MTTVAVRRYKDKVVIAADTQLTWGKERCTTHKLEVLSDGSILGLCGEAVMCDKLRDWWDGGCEGDSPMKVKQDEAGATKDDNDTFVSGLLVDIDGEVFILLNGTDKLKATDEFLTDGSGGPYARMAMQYGASPEEAIKQASKFDVYTNDVVDVIEIELGEET